MNLRVAVQLGRVSNLPTIWTNVLAGTALAGAQADLGTLGFLLIALSLFYTGGMYLNDAFDARHDARYRPDRPIPSGKIRARTVFALGFAQLGAGMAIVLFLSLIRSDHPVGGILCGLLLAGCIVFYDAFHKKNPLGPAVMGLCRALVYLTVAGALAGLGLSVLAGAAVLMAYVVGLTYAAKQEGRQKIRRIWPLALVAAPFVYLVPVLGSGGLGTVAVLLFALRVALSLWLLLRDKRKNVQKAVVGFLAGICLLDASILAGLQQMNAAGFALACFALTILLQKYVKGT